MGNCGVGFAPCRPDERDMLVELMEGVEDIPEIVMTEGLPWNWETFPQYLDAIGSRKLDIDVAAQLPHSALRLYVMGERALRKEDARPEDLATMRALTTEAVRAGALGVTTSRNLMHRTQAGELAPSLFAEEQELLALAGGLKDAQTVVFQIIPDIVSDTASEFDIMRRLAQASGRPLSFSLMQMPTRDPAAWSDALRLLEEANADGLSMKAQVFPRPVGMLYGLNLSFHPFSLHPSYQAIADLSLPEKVAAMRDPAMRAKLLSEAPQDPNPVRMKIVHNTHAAYPMGEPPCYEPDLNDRIDRQAAARGLSFEEYVYDLLLEDEGQRLLFLPGANYRDGNLDAALTMAVHPQTILGLGDGGAHYGMICDASYPTFLLQRFVRDAPAGQAIGLAQAVASLSDAPARCVGLNDRGRIAVGYKADVNVIDLDRLQLHMPRVVRDLPAGGRRLQQQADGFVATLVAGVVTYRDGASTGELPGRLVRGGQLAPA
ncbi:MAG: amidohydrolase family protein [Phenylobacterium sp.]|uniref:N-acyl-D-amino-acid deacylase family protein n=1 Tax=Phenylobacterium sp. TaxID=1871053 RepID=UPI0027333BC9|nr:amidohydrolase family protein [Phenylobacterium sp.]MDP3175642.1 amidohydrolase family protein [Phenylobacterium sp.]